MSNPPTIEHGNVSVRTEVTSGRPAPTEAL